MSSLGGEGQLVPSWLVTLSRLPPTGAMWGPPREGDTREGATEPRVMPL